jgi:hypothetical protein
MTENNIITARAPLDLAAIVIGEVRAMATARLLGLLARLSPDTDSITRADFAQLLNLVLFARLLDGVPTGAAYVADRQAAGESIRFDHGALRTIMLGDSDTGGLPGGHRAFARILEPLGYEEAGLYPLPGLKMTGRAYAHRDEAEDIPQFFVSELHVDRFSPEFAAAAHRVFDATVDPLDADAVRLLARFAEHNTAPIALAAAGLPAIVAAFGRHHPLPRLADYEALLAESAEAAWIATEGNAFNHATDRVPDVETLATAQRALGRPMKDKVEYSTSGRVRQTAFRADPVTRAFIAEDGGQVTRAVPGSFYEFITRDIDPATGRLDLRFDSGNAQGIFTMTRV